MGVPGFFHWICQRIPKTVQDAKEEQILQNEEAKLVGIIKPQKLIYMAIDGVAPRAKLNQQRSRRFRTAKENEKNKQIQQDTHKFLQYQGVSDKAIDDYIESSFDSNSITPGTVFMQELSEVLSYYIIERMNNNPLWKNLNVILNDAKNPGEGEHKILDFIRVQRSQANYNPNIRHCIYGADADLLMLGLATHEIYFYIIRETFVQKKDKKCSKCNLEGHFSYQCKNERSSKITSSKDQISQDLGTLFQNEQNQTDASHHKHKADENQNQQLNKDQQKKVCRYFDPQNPEHSCKKQNQCPQLHLTIEQKQLHQQAQEQHKSQLSEQIQGDHDKQQGQQDKQEYVKQITHKENNKKVCKYFDSNNPENSCKKKDQCIFLHIQKNQDVSQVQQQQNEGQSTINQQQSVQLTNKDGNPIIQQQKIEKLCFKCQKTGHFANKCQENQQQGEGGQSEKLCFKCQKAGHFASKCPNQSKAGQQEEQKSGQEPTCYICHQTGHQKSKCPQRHNQEIFCFICGEHSHFYQDCKKDLGQFSQQLQPQNLEKISSQNLGQQQQDQQQSVAQNSKTGEDQQVQVRFQYAKIYVVRQYLELFFDDLKSKIKFEYDLERIIDDFVFLCYLLGNDFLPHIPNFQIREGGVDALLFLYKQSILKFTDGYISNMGQLNVNSFQIFIKEVQKVEQAMIESMINKQNRRKHYNQQSPQKKTLNTLYLQTFNGSETNNSSILQKFKLLVKEIIKQETQQVDEYRKHVESINEQKADLLIQQENKEMTYKELYYSTHHGILKEDLIQFQQSIRFQYFQALTWNIAYYYQGCASWAWYYPYNYPPFLTDLTELQNLNIQFQPSQPFTCHQQLLAVFPAGSRQQVPKCYQRLMTDDDSDIIDFYPSDFYVDLRGKMFSWQGEVILPFIEQERLIKAMQKYENELTEEEKKRNQPGFIIYYTNSQQYQQYAQELNYQRDQIAGQLETYTQNLSQLQKPGKFSKINHLAENINENTISSYKFTNPQKFKHESKLQSGVIYPKRELTLEDFQWALESFQKESIINVISKKLDEASQMDAIQSIKE